MTEAVVNEIPLEAHLLQLTTAVGGNEIDIETGFQSYVLGDEAYGKYSTNSVIPECLKDIKQLLRLDDRSEDKYVSRLLGEWKFFQNDLIPIFVSNNDENKRKKHHKIIEAVLELMVPLSWPVDLSSPYYVELNNYLREYLVSICSSESNNGNGVLRSVLEICLHSLAKDSKEIRDQENVQLCLYFIRNLIKAYETIEADVNLFCLMNECHLIEMLVTFASSMKDTWFKQWNSIILEIFYLMFCCTIEPESLAQPYDSFNVSDKNGQENFIAAASSEWNPRFKGTYSVFLGSGNRYILSTRNNPSTEVTRQTMLDKSKKKTKVSKKKMKEISQLSLNRADRVLSLPERTILFNTANSILESSFNIMMQSVKKDIIMEKITLNEDDYRRFLLLAKYFFKFIRFSSNESLFSPIITLLDLETLNLLLRRIDSSKDGKNIKHLQVSVKFMAEWLLVVDMLSLSSDPEERAVSRGLQSNLFYREDDLHLLLSLVRNPTSMETVYLEDCIEMTHVLMRFMERYFKENCNAVVLRKKRKRNTTDNDIEESIEEDREKYKEIKAEFGKMELKLANESTIETYIDVLKGDLRILRKGTIHYITKFLYRLFVKNSVDVLMFKLSYLHQFHIILKQRRELIQSNGEFRELVEFIRFYVRTFTDMIKKHSTLLVDVFFPKTKGEWMEIKGFLDEDVRISDDEDFAAPQDSVLEPVTAENQEEPVQIEQEQVSDKVEYLEYATSDDEQDSLNM